MSQSRLNMQSFQEAEDKRKQDRHKVVLWRRLVFGVALIPFLALASIPAIGFVLSQNVPAESSSNWWASSFENVLVVGCIKLVYSRMMMPSVARFLSRIRWGVKDRASGLKSEIVIELYSTQVSILLLAEVTSVLFAPMSAYAPRPPSPAGGRPASSRDRL